MRKFIYLCSHLCVQVPLLPIAVLTVIPLAVCPSWRPWGAADIPVLGNPGVGQWIVIIVVAYTIIDTVRGMIDDLQHGRVGVDLLAVVAIAATVAVQEYWASWAVVLMISSGEAIEEYAQSKAESSLTALMTAAPQTAHVVRRPGVGVAGVNTGDGSDGSSDDRGVHRATASARSPLCRLPPPAGRPTLRLPTMTPLPWNPSPPAMC